MNDGAAAIVVAAASQLTKLGIDTPPMAKIVSWAQVGIDPLVMGISPITAIKKAVSELCTLNSLYNYLVLLLKNIYLASHFYW